MVAMRDSSGAALAARRFAGLEPLGFEAGDNNWYRFVANEPTEKTDPSGLDVLALPIAGGAATCGVATGGAAVAPVLVAGGACVAVGAVGYGVGTCIDRIGCNPFTPVLVGAVEWYYTPKTCDKRLRTWTCTAKARNWSVGTSCYGKIFTASAPDRASAYSAAFQLCVSAGCHRPGSGGDCGHITCYVTP